MYYDKYEHAKFEDLKGQLLISVERGNDEYYDGDFIKFVTSEGEEYVMYHFQDCCEDVYIESIAGELSDLVGEPILMAGEAYNTKVDGGKHSCESETWTFYKLATRKGYVDIRWYGSSNGYYSESVNFVRMLNNKSN